MTSSADRRQSSESLVAASSVSYESIGPSKPVPSESVRGFLWARGGRGLASATGIGLCRGADDATATSIASTCTCTTCLGGTIHLGDLGRGLVLGIILSVTVISVAAIVFAWHASGGGRSRGDGSTEERLQRGSSWLSADSAEVSGSPARGDWCLPNAVHQTFSGLIRKDRDDVMLEGKWQGDHWWYHDDITNCLHIVATIAGETYGFWEAGIINVSGTTNYLTAAYKNDECVFYGEEMEAGEPFNDVMCRGSAWAGNVTFQDTVEYGYGTRAERWGGTIPEVHNSGDWGLPPGTESLVDFQRNPDNDGEVRLLYHRVIAPTEGVLSWAQGQSLAFDFVFTGVEKMASAEVQELVKVPKICETKAGEFHDEEALRNQARWGSRRRAAVRRALLDGEAERASRGLEGAQAPPEVDLDPVLGMLAALGPRRNHRAKGGA